MSIASTSSGQETTPKLVLRPVYALRWSLKCRCQGDSQQVGWECRRTPCGSRSSLSVAYLRPNALSIGSRLQDFTGQGGMQRSQRVVQSINDESQSRVGRARASTPKSERSILGILLLLVRLYSSYTKLSGNGYRACARSVHRDLPAPSLAHRPLLLSPPIAA